MSSRAWRLRITGRPSGCIPARYFPRFSRGRTAGLTACTRGMSQNPVTYQHMEEFLIAAGRKEPVHIRLEKDRKDMERVESTLKDSLEILRDSWGYLRIDIQTEGDFLQVEKKVITRRRFHRKRLQSGFPGDEKPVGKREEVWKNPAENGLRDGGL